MEPMVFVVRQMWGKYDFGAVRLLGKHLPLTRC